MFIDLFRHMRYFMFIQVILKESLTFCIKKDPEKENCKISRFCDTGTAVNHRPCATDQTQRYIVYTLQSRLQVHTILLAHLR